MHELPKFTKCFISFSKAVFIKFNCIKMLSFINCTGYFELANIPPTLPAQLIIISGQLFLMNFFN